MSQNVTAGQPTAATNITRARQMAFEVERQFREMDGSVFFALPRVVRRVVQNQLEFASPWLPPPHRKSCVVERDRLLWLAARDELGIESGASLPRRIILLARPEESRLAQLSREDLQRYYWRVLFHARIDFELETAWPSCGGALPNWGRPSSTRRDRCCSPSRCCGGPTTCDTSTLNLSLSITSCGRSHLIYCPSTFRRSTMKQKS
ncbi:MAG: hypothetical protein HY290_21985 [Planctomycetia bacterium]|nr:hypothetical protein [Planctomycetia bacterium]